MKRKSLNKIVSVFLLTFIFGTFFVLYLVKIERDKPDDPRETVELFGKLLEKVDRKSMENYVTTEPLPYRKQIFDRMREKAKTLPALGEPVDQKPNVVSEAEPKEPIDFPRHMVDSTRLLDKVARASLFEPNRYIKQIGDVIEKDGQAIVDVKLGDKKDLNAIIRTKFWLHKETDGQWRIFLISNFEFNPQWAH